MEGGGGISRKEFKSSALDSRSLRRLPSDREVPEAELVRPFDEVIITC